MSTRQVKKLKMGIRSTDDVLRETAETMKSVAEGKKVRPKTHRLFFTSPEALRRFLTPKRFELERLSWIAGEFEFDSRV